jgi:hypothetical protein
MLRGVGLPLLARHLARLRSASSLAISVAAAGSLIGQVAAVAQAAPVWVFVVVALAPWIPILLLELLWTYHHFRWLALFCILIVSQSAYLLDHAARAVQLHILGRPAQQATGIFGMFDAERIQLLWTIWAALGVLLLVSRFHRNPWLWATAAVGILHAAEHILLFTSGAPLTRVDWQLAYSVLEVVTLNLAFAVQLGRTYDAWLARAFPNLPERVLIAKTAQLEEVRLRPGERIEHYVGRLYIVTRGTGTLMRSGPGGHEILLRVLFPGQVVVDAGTLVADTSMEMLALPAGCF